MTNKKGFLLIDLTMGIVLFAIFTLIVAGYVVKTKVIYKNSLQKIEALSLARTILEKQKTEKRHVYQSSSPYTVLHSKTGRSSSWKCLTVSNNTKELSTLMYMSDEMDKEKYETNEK